MSVICKNTVIFRGCKQILIALKEQAIGSIATAIICFCRLSPGRVGLVICCGGMSKTYRKQQKFAGSK
jgi:hypothetical protein